MNLFGLTITRTKATPNQLEAVDWSTRSGWWPLIRESFAGAWQSNVTVQLTDVLTHYAVYACITLIASDVSKMRPRLMRQDDDGIWSETESPAFSPVLRKPNHYQNRIKFYEWWIASKLIHGNAYALKQRDSRGVVTALYLLDPTRVRALVAPDSSVYYELKRDNLSRLEEQVVTVPASEIIHDVMVPFYHPLVGVSPITACGLAAIQGLRIQENSTLFFSNGSKPGGILLVPGPISQESADRIKTAWETNFSGDNTGKLAVLADGMSYQSVAVNAHDSQLIEQLKWTAEVVCSCFHVPPYMIGVGPPPNYNNIEALNQQYYSQCLQALIESLEIALDEGLGLAPNKVEGVRYGVGFDLDDLLKMDSATKMQTAKDGVSGGIWSPNEARRKFDLKPVQGGATPYLQQQNFSLGALDRRDQTAPAPASTTSETPAAPAAPAMPMPLPTPPAERPDEMRQVAELMLARSAVIARKYATVPHAA